MATYGATITAMLNADTSLKSLLIGGIVEFTTEGRKGISRVDFVKSFIVNKPIMLPLCIVYEADESDTKELGVSDRGFRAVKVPIHLWLYTDGNDDYSAIDAAYARIYTLLQQSPITGGYQIYYERAIKNKREEILNNAAFYDVLFTVYGYRTQ